MTALLLSAIVLAARILLPGWLWAGVVPAAAEEEGRFLRVLQQGARALVLGLLLNLLPALAAASIACWTPAVDWSLWGAVVVLGMLRAARARDWSAARRVDAAAVGVALVVLIIAGVALPLRSEWIAGGLDPGLYQNNAITIDRQQGLQPRTDPVYAGMSEAERATFSRHSGTYHEIFPGVPIRLRDGALPLYFFHLTPLCGAWFHRLGGLDLLQRLPAVLALLGIWPACALLARLAWRGWRLAAVVVLWCLSPMWWYQQAVPTSELLYILLLTGALLFYLDAVARRTRIPLAAAFALFAATVNHFNAPVVAAMMLPIAAAAESAANTPQRLSRMLACVGALALGIVWDLAYAPATILRLQEKDHVLQAVLIPFVLLSATAIGLAAWRVPAPVAARAGRLVRLACGVGAVALAALVACFAMPDVWAAGLRLTVEVPVLGAALVRLRQFYAFHGAAWMLGVALGIWCLARDRAPERAVLRLVALGLGLVLGSLLLHGGIAPIYPWALRRFVIVAQPFMVLALGAIVLRALNSGGSLTRAGRVTAVALLLAAAADGLRHSRAAAQVGDFRGLTAALAALSARIEPEDVVVVDDPRWGTPLLLAYGHHTINGSLLWDRRDPAQQAQFLESLRAVQHRTAGRVLWLTSTDKGLSLYPATLGPITPVLENFLFAYETVIHSARADRFAMRENLADFSLYAWTPQN